MNKNVDSDYWNKIIFEATTAKIQTKTKEAREQTQ
jgi:hypothetical protein